jgi:hypothetical protein
LEEKMNMQTVGSNKTKEVQTHHLYELLGDAKKGKVDIIAGDGNLNMEALAGDDKVLAEGSLQYFENQGLPLIDLDSKNGSANLTIKGGRAEKPWFHLPWSACNGAKDWQIRLNPDIPLDIKAHSNGGNVRLDLAGMIVTHVSADTDGGNVDVILPDSAGSLCLNAETGAGNVTVEIGKNTGSSTVSARSGAGNVIVNLPRAMAARIQAKTGLGKEMIDPSFSKVDEKTYQSPGFDSAENKVEILVSSGAGNVTVVAR